MSRPGISAVFPCYNDAGTIGTVIEKTLAVVAPLADEYEVVVVENGSTDHTRDVLAEAEERFGSHLRVLRFAEPLGYGGAVRAGFDEARFPLVFYTDGDAQYDVAELPLLYEAMRSEEAQGRRADVVTGRKIARHDAWPRRLASWAWQRANRLVFRYSVHDIDCDFRIIKRHVLQSLALRERHGTFPLELMTSIHDAGFRTVEVAVHHYPRAYGESEFFQWRYLWRTAVDWFRLLWRLRLSRLVGTGGAAV
jgi:glycosyltransferase involved in cell wall biosynthesis